MKTLLKVYCVASMCVGAIGLFVLANFAAQEKNPVGAILCIVAMIGILITLIFSEGENNKPNTATS